MNQKILQTSRKAAANLKSSKTKYMIIKCLFCCFIIAFLSGCATVEQTGRSCCVCDYGSWFLDNEKKHGASNALSETFAFLLAQENPEKEINRCATDFLFRDDEILPFLRNPLIEHKHPEIAKYLICFIRDDADIDHFNDGPHFRYKQFRTSN